MSRQVVLLVTCDKCKAQAEDDGTIQRVELKKGDVEVAADLCPACRELFEARVRVFNFIVIGTTDVPALGKKNGRSRVRRHVCPRPGCNRLIAAQGLARHLAWHDSQEQ